MEYSGKKPYVTHGISKVRKKFLSLRMIQIQLASMEKISSNSILKLKWAEPF